MPDRIVSQHVNPNIAACKPNITNSARRSKTKSDPNGPISKLNTFLRHILKVKGAATPPGKVCNGAARTGREGVGGG